MGADNWGLVRDSGWLVHNAGFMCNVLRGSLRSHTKKKVCSSHVFICLVQIHLKNRELENTKLSAELQMLKSVDVNKENTIAQLKEELSRVKACLAEKDKQHRQLLANSSPSVHMHLVYFSDGFCTCAVNECNSNLRDFFEPSPILVSFLVKWHQAF